MIDYLLIFLLDASLSSAKVSDSFSAISWREQVKS